MTNSKYNLFVGSYASENESSIYGMTLDTASGELSSKSSYSGIESPSFLTIHPNGRWLYAVSETGMSSHGMHGSVHAFEIQPDSLELKPINHQSAKGDWTCHVEIDHTGRWLVATNYGSGDAALYPILADGALGEMASFVQHAGSGPNKARQEGPHAHSAVFTPDNNYVIVADLGIDQLAMYTFDAQSGALTKHAEVAANPGSGPRHFAFHPNNRILYCANELDSSVTVYAYDATAGALEPLQTLSTLPAANPESSVADIHISPEGEHLYISNRGHNSVAVYKVDADGRLSALGFPSCGGNWPRNFALGVDGRQLLIANRRTNDIVTLSVDLAQVEMSKIQSQVSIMEPSCIKLIK
ncbi:MAG: lactonase family protein [Anaerolineae bacterium]